MISAWTHVGGDTLRTLAVFAAALVSSVTGIDGDICDAWAAIVSGLTIVVLLGYVTFEIIIASRRRRLEATGRLLLVGDEIGDLEKQGLMAGSSSSTAASGTTRLDSPVQMSPVVTHKQFHEYELVPVQQEER